MDTVKVSQCIVCTKSRRGKGDNKMSPIRVLTEVFDFDGTLIAENDPCSIPIESLVDFINYRFKGEQKNEVLEWVYQYFLSE